MRLLQEAEHRGHLAVAAGAAFTAECQRKFHELDTADTGYIDKAQLRGGLGEMFPAVRQELLDERSGTLFLPLTECPDILIEAFDEDGDGRLTLAEFAPLLRFCQAWRYEQCWGRSQRLPAACTPRKGSLTSKPSQLLSAALTAAEAEIPHGGGACWLEPVATDSSSVAEARTRSSSSTGPLGVTRPAPRPRPQETDETAAHRPKAGSSKQPRPSTAGPVPAQQQRANTEGLPKPRPMSTQSAVALRRQSSVRALPLQPTQRESSRETTRPKSTTRQGAQDGVSSSPPRRGYVGRSPSPLPRERPPEQASEKKPARRRLRSVSREPVDLETAQVEAIMHLVESMEPRRTCLSELTLELLQHILARDGYVAFTRTAMEQAAGDLPHVRAASGDGGAPSMAELFVRVVRSLAASHNLAFGEVAGQVLWRSRRSKALQSKARHRRIAEEMSWIVEAHQVDTLMSHIDLVYDACADGGKMKWRGWQRAIQLVLKNPVLQGRVKHSVADRIFYNTTHKTSAATSTVSSREFKEMLVDLAEQNVVHPGIIFLTVASHRGVPAIAPSTDADGIA